MVLELNKMGKCKYIYVYIHEEYHNYRYNSQNICPQSFLPVLIPKIRVSCLDSKQVPWVISLNILPLCVFINVVFSNWVSVMVHFTCHLPWAEACSDNW